MSSLFSTTSNISVYSIPLYYLLCTAPHAVAILIASQGNLSKWDNRNPRSSDMKASLRKRLGEERYARYERAEAAHYNSLESFPLVAATVAFANMARLETADINRFVVGQVLLRILYQVVYIRTSRQGPTFFRTAVWYVLTGWCLRMLWKSAGMLA